MVVVKLEHSDLAQHQASIFKTLQAFRKEGQLCDVVLKSCDGTEHGAHTAVLCAASAELKNMLVGQFREANQVQEGQPVEMAASDAVVLALLEYIYGDQPQVELDDSLELLRLADAYNFPGLGAAIEHGLCAVLDSAPVTTALKVLQLPQDLHRLKAACEEKVAANFESCIDLVNFVNLSAGQLGRILRREDLRVSREEVVVKGLFNWFNKSKDGGALGALLHHIDFQSLSSSNLAPLRRLSASMGPIGHDLQREVTEALRVHKKRSAEKNCETFRPKRRCLQLWSPELGASSQAPQKVLPDTDSICLHDGAIYYSRDRSVLRWKPGDIESQTVVDEGARVNGSNDPFLGGQFRVSPEGEILVTDFVNRRLVSFRNGTGKVVFSDVLAWSVFFSPNGSVYVLTEAGRAVEKLVGATLQQVISSKNLPAELQFSVNDLFVTKEDVIYMSDGGRNGRVLRLNPGEAQPVVVGEAPNKESSLLDGLFVTEEGKVYVADSEQRKVWAFHPSDAAWTEVLTCPGELQPLHVLVQGKSLYVSMEGAGSDPDAPGVYEYLLPPELQLD
eukprot:Skav219833  [mRNA]  locus=scaffold859:28236:29918:+ [translate_table: standard]